MKTNYKKVSSHGSVSIPVAMRRELGIQGGDPMVVSMDGDSIVIKAYQPHCVVCGSTDNIRRLYSKNICTTCCLQAIDIVEGETNGS